METRPDIIVIGASAGGIEALRAVVAELPPDLGAAVFVVIHTSGRHHGILARILGRASKLPVEMARPGEPMQSGCIHVAWPDHHLVLEDGIVHVARGPRVNRCRPAIDVLFRSAAESHGPRVIGVVLTGLLDDGAAGLVAIKRAGGVTIVQDPNDALYGEMPQHALDTGAVDHRLPLAHIPEALVRLTGKTVPVPDRKPEAKEHVMEKTGPAGTASYYTCPECGGVLREIVAGDFVDFLCHVGHRFSTQALLDGQDDVLEYALWEAVRVLEEKAHFYRRLGNRYLGGRLAPFSQTLAEKAEGVERIAGTIRQFIENGVAAKVDEPPGEVSRN